MEEHFCSWGYLYFIIDCCNLIIDIVQVKNLRNHTESKQSTRFNIYKSKPLFNTHHITWNTFAGTFSKKFKAQKIQNVNIVSPVELINLPLLHRLSLKHTHTHMQSFFHRKWAWDPWPAVDQLCLKMTFSVAFTDTHLAFTLAPNRVFLTFGVFMTHPWALDVCG